MQAGQLTRKPHVELGPSSQSVWRVNRAAAKNRNLHVIRNKSRRKPVAHAVLEEGLGGRVQLAAREPPGPPAWPCALEEDEEAKRSHAISNRLYLHLFAHWGGRIRRPRVQNGEPEESGSSRYSIICGTIVATPSLKHDTSHSSLRALASLRVKLDCSIFKSSTVILTSIRSLDEENVLFRPAENGSARLTILC